MLRVENRRSTRSLSSADDATPADRHKYMSVYVFPEGKDGGALKRSGEASITQHTSSPFKSNNSSSASDHVLSHDGMSIHQGNHDTLTSTHQFSSYLPNHTRLRSIHSLPDSATRDTWATAFKAAKQKYHDAYVPQQRSTTKRRNESANRFAHQELLRGHCSVRLLSGLLHQSHRTQGGIGVAWVAAWDLPFPQWARCGVQCAVLLSATVISTQRIAAVL
ncbi:uncharacterized protein M421DRAFT_327260 [Didymella exigua CBS 183.55]|uniref:Uncharacterized protein n=1 Tax=Didymella exigua CBS 183.55 TaxID=1150837 RepID=A0A6A5R6C1_9PLEO|nr:uncharacterized protein M421DRAFT_327260 [Didymella exigua CBS 183.55]KAF1923262.1 hypothetical protein M421DRAFT_327260 [Didymella exigua CBS 183.55]